MNEYRGRNQGEYGGERRHKDGGRHGGAQTFRRGRALEFYELLHVRRNTLKQQVEAPELQEIRSILLGELKAVQQIMDEYARHFQVPSAPPSHEDQQG